MNSDTPKPTMLTASPVDPPDSAQAVKQIVKDDGEGIQSHTLYLDKDKVKKFEITAPLEVSKQEFDRIKKWLEAVLNVGDEQQQ